MINKIVRCIALLLSMTAKSQTVITDVTIVDVEHKRLADHQSVLIEKNIIKTIAPAAKLKIPANATIIKGTGKFLLPGLIDAHAHLWDGDLYSDDGIDLAKFKPVENAIEEYKARMGTNYKRFLECGITTVISPGSTISTFRINDSLSKKTRMPSMYVAGKLITVSDFGNEHHLSPVDEYYDYAFSVEAAKTIVQKQLALRPDFIKILFVPDLTWKHIEDSAKAKFPIVKTIIDEAHKNGLKVAVHATERITAQLAVEAGCDYLVHGIHDEIVGDEFVRLLKEKHTLLCPTSNVEYPMLRVFAQNLPYTDYEMEHADPAVIKTFFDLQDLDTALFRTSKLRWEANKKIYRRDSIRLINLKKLADAGIRIAAGTDAGSLGSLPAASYLPELLKMKTSGMDNWQILQSATLNPTYFINKEKLLGSITSGKLADMILLNQNPVADLVNLDSIALVFKNGEVISPGSLIDETPEMTVQRLWNAYNAKNRNAFLATLDLDVLVYDESGSVLHSGIKEIDKNFSPQLQAGSKTHCEIKNRIASNNSIVDKIWIKEASRNNVRELIVLYKVSNHKIKRITILKQAAAEKL